MEIPPPPRDDRSFVEFYRYRYWRMIGFVRSATGRKVSDHESVAGEGWRKFYPHWKLSRHPDAYLRRCILSAINDALARVAERPEVDSLEQLPARVVASSKLAAPYASSNAQGAPWDPELTNALAQLSPPLRDIVLLDNELDPGERPVQEIAKILGIKRVTAHMRLKRAYAKLRELLPDDYLELRKVSKQGREGLEGSERS
jgi:RNA polymerase sigma factor (sigma-70 family)